MRKARGKDFLNYLTRILRRTLKKIYKGFKRVLPLSQKVAQITARKL